MKMISIKYLILVASCIAYSSGEEQKPEEITTTPKDETVRDVPEFGYFRYSNPIYIYPSSAERNFRLPVQQNPTETNEIEGSSEVRNRPLFIFTNYRNPGPSPQRLSDAPYIEIRKKREATEEVPDSSKVPLLRRKRTYCRKCGGGGGGYGGYGGYAAYPVYSVAAYPVAAYPVAAAPVAAYPVYSGGHGGGCNTCGGGGGGSYSYSSSSSKSSSGSYGWGK